MSPLAAAGSALGLFLLFWLPGLAVCAAVAGNGGERSPWPQGAVLSLALGVAVSALAAVGLAAAGLFSLPAEIAAVGTIVLVVLAAGRFRLAVPFRAAPDFSGVALIVLVGLAGAAFFGRPFEMLLGGRDATTYLVGGVALSRQGSLVLRDRASERVGPEAMRTISGWREREKRVRRIEGVKYQGFFYVDVARGRLIAQGGHLWPAIIAIFHSALGLPGAFAAPTAVGVVAVAAVFTAGSLLVGTLASFLGTALLAIDLVQVWMARYPVAEILVQMLLFAGFAAFLRRDRLGDSVAGVLFGAALFTKIEVALLAVPFGVLALRDFARGRPPARKWLWATLGVLVPAAALYWVAVEPDYLLHALLIFSKTQGGLWENTVEAIGLPATIALVAAGTLLVGVLASRLRVPSTTALGRTFAVAVVLLTVYGFWIRPLNLLPSSGAERSMVWLSWYVSPLVLFVGIAALALFLVRETSREKLTVLAALLLFSFVFLQLPFVNLRQIYMTRRFVPAALPMLFLFFGFALAELPRRLRWRALAAAVAVCLFAAAAATLIQRGRHVFDHREYPGAERQIAGLADRLRAADLVLLTDHQVANAIGPPLELVYGIPTVVFPRSLYESGLVESWLDRGWTVMALSRQNGLSKVPGAEEFDLVDRPVLVLRQLETAFDRFPLRVERFMLPLWRFAAGEGAHPLYGWWRREGEAVLRSICSSGAVPVGGDPFLVRRFGRVCGRPEEGVSHAILAAAAQAGTWQRWLEASGATFERRSLGPVVLFDGLAPRAAPDARPLAPGDWTIRASHGEESVRRAFDGDPATRWGTAAPQRPGMALTIVLPEPTDVDWVRLRTGRFPQDRARRLALEVSTDGARWTRMELPPLDGAIVWGDGGPRVDRSGNVDFWVGMRDVRALRVVNLGESSHFDWSIAELVVEGRPGSGS